MMKRILGGLAAAMLAGCAVRAPQMPRQEAAQPAAAECAPPAPKVRALGDAQAQEEGVIYLVMPQKTMTPRCDPLTAEGKPHVTTQSFGPVSKVEVTQAFRNETGQTVNADWRLAVPVNGVILDLKATIGARHFRAVVVEAEQAAALYALAIRQGKRAAIARADETGGWHLRLGQVRAGERVETGVVYAQRTTMKQSHPSADAIPLLAALEAHEKILGLLALDRASGRLDHAKQAYDLARAAKIVSPVSSLLMVDAKGK